MASYASGLSKSGRLQQVPLGKALKEYAGANNKAALLKLLAPIHTASKQCKLLADLVETQDIYHPLVWLPAEAYQFLQSVPELEDAGLLVRLPDWWKKRTRRPQVAAKIGSAKRSSVGEYGLLDVTLNVEVDGHALSTEEIEALLAGDDGLILLRGQWVEVDREKLQQALAHWRRIAAHGDISFATGMRWLAGAPADLASSGDTSEILHEWAFAEAGEALTELLQQLKDPAQLAPRLTTLATPHCAPTSKPASTGCGCARKQASARAWQTTWASAKRSSYWRPYCANSNKPHTPQRHCWWCPPP